MGPLKGVLVVGADHFQRVFIDKEKIFSAEMGYIDQLGTFYKGGLLLRDFDDHRMQRRIMQTAFKFEAMRAYSHTINSITAKHINPAVVLGASASNRQSSAKPVIFYPWIKQTLLELGTNIFLGEQDFNQQAKRLGEAFVNVNKGLVSVLRWRIPGSKIYQGLKGVEELHRYVSQQIELRRNNPGTDMLSHMCLEKNEQGQYFSDLEIIQHIVFLLFAAHDTTTSALTHMMMYLGRNQPLQDQLRQQSLDLAKDCIDFDDQGRLPLLDLCMMEVLRLHPPVPTMNRRTTVETEFGGFRIPANTLLILPSSYNQRDSKYWTNPDEFDPLRFAEGREEHKVHSYCYHPFGGGAHKCIGMHFAQLTAKCFMHQFLLNYQFSTPDHYQPKLQWVPLPKPADGVPLILKALQ